MSGTFKLKSISIDSSGKLWGIGFTDDHVYSSPNGIIWTEYSTNAVGTVVHAFVVGGGGMPVPYLLGLNGGLWKGTGSTFTPINVVQP